MAVPSLFPHLLKGIREIKGTNLLGILKLQKLVPAMSRHVHQYVTPVVGEQPLAPRHLRPHAVRQQPNKVLHGNLIPPIIHLDIVTIQINSPVRVAVYSTWKGIARVAGHVVGEHEDDLGVGDAETLDGSVHGEDVSEMAVVEPKAGCADEDGPVAGVFGEDGGCEEGECQGGLAQEIGELHRGGVLWSSS